MSNGKQTAPAGHISRVDLCHRLGIARPTIRSWVHQGCPQVVANGRTHYDPDKVAAWLRSIGKARYARKLMAPAPAPADKRGAEQSAAMSEPVTTPTSAPAPVDWSDVLRQAEHVKNSAFRRWVQASDGEKEHYQVLWQQAVEQQRKLKKDHADIEESLKRMMPISEHERLMVETHGIVAQGLRQFAKRVAGMVVGKKLAECYTILDAEVRAVMRGFAEDEDNQT